MERIPIIFQKVYDSKDAKPIKVNRRSAKRIRLSAGSEDADQAVNVIDLRKIRDKVESNAYTSLDEFLVDFQWFAHNYEVMFTGKFNFK